MHTETALHMARSPFLEISDAVVMRAGNPILSVDAFTLACGEHIALLGPNGSGKSTFVRLLTREVFPLHREVPPVRFKGRDRVTLEEVKRCLGVVSSSMQDQISVHIPARDVVAGGLFATLGIPAHVSTSDAQKALMRADETLELLGVGSCAHRDVMTLSTGQARRVLIARALVHDPETLVFDEPCTGLDPEGMYYVRASMRTLAQAGKGIVLVTHYPEDVIPEIKRLLLLRDGRIYADGAKEELFTDEVMSNLFQIPVHVQRSTRANNATTACASTGARVSNATTGCVSASNQARNTTSDNNLHLAHDAAHTSSVGDAHGEAMRGDDVREEYFSLVSAY